MSLAKHCRRSMLMLMIFSIGTATWCRVLKRKWMLEKLRAQGECYGDGLFDEDFSRDVSMAGSSHSACRDEMKSPLPDLSL